MNLLQLTGWHNRLKAELSIAYAKKPWHGGQIDRITDEMAIAEREISRLSRGRTVNPPSH